MKRLINKVQNVVSAFINKVQMIATAFYMLMMTAKFYKSDLSIEISNRLDDFIMAKVDLYFPLRHQIIESTLLTQTI